MPVKLRVTHEADDGGDPSEYFFEQDRITIGRGSDNHLTLPDPKRIVSSKHAEVRQSGETYQLVDRGSKNFTYLRNQRLEAGEPYELRAGDVFRIGEFAVEFTPVEAETTAPAADETVFAADFSNPFEDPADHLLEALHELIEAYERESQQRRDDALKEAFHNVDELGTHDAVHRVLELLGVQPRGDDTGATPARAPESSPGASSPTPPENRPPEEASQTEPPTETPRESAPSRSGPSSELPSERSRSGPAVQASDDVADTVIDTLLASISRIIGIPWQFRHEFIGQTIMQSAETQFLYDGDVQTMKAHLMDPSISNDERENRLDHVEDAAEALAVHQVAMLNGYKASVMNGTEELMERLNPDAHQHEVMDQSALYEYVPMLASPAVLDRLRAQWNELQMGDWSVAEQRIFRPAFIKAYLARMTAVRPSDKDTHT